MNDENKRTLWGWVADNPMTVLMIFLVMMGFLALIVGYKEGVMSIITGIFGWMKGNDNAESKQKLDEARRHTDIKIGEISNLLTGMKEQQITHDTEVDEIVENAKAECDEMDIDELIDIGRDMFRDRSAFGNQEN